MQIGSKNQLRNGMNIVGQVLVEEEGFGALQLYQVLQNHLDLDLEDLMELCTVDFSGQFFVLLRQLVDNIDEKPEFIEEFFQHLNILVIDWEMQ